MVAAIGGAIAPDKAKLTERLISINVSLGMKLQGKGRTALSKALGLSESSTSRKLNGATAWSVADLVNAAEFLNTTPDKLMNNEFYNMFREQPSSVLAGRGMGPSSVEPPAGFGPTTC